MMWVAGAGVLPERDDRCDAHAQPRRPQHSQRAHPRDRRQLLSTAAVIIGGWIILRTGYSIVDPILSIMIGGLILWSSFGIIRESLNILLEGIPRGVRLKEATDCVRQIRGVLDVHDLHVLEHR